MKKHLRKIAWGSILGMVVLGLGNALVINMQSEISSDITYVKGLDEMYGVTQPGRILATNSSWKKIEDSVDSESREQLNQENKGEEQVSEISEDLNLELVEVINPRIWAKGIMSSDFEGELQTSSGRIESLTVSLPGKEEISLSYAEMSGNVFEYDYAGEIYSGIMYQVDPKTYMITLSNGPLEGTRLRFTEAFSPEQVEVARALREDHNINVGHLSDRETHQDRQEDYGPVQQTMVESQMVNLSNEAG